MTLEPELLQVWSPAESPTGEIDGGGEEVISGAPVWVGQASRGQDGDWVEEGVETKTSKAEFYAHPFGEEVVRVEVDVLPPQVLCSEPGQQRRREGDAWVWVRERLPVRDGVAEQVELQVHGADEVEVHFSVKDATGNDSAWVVDGAEEIIAEKAGGSPGALGDDPGAECQADDEGTHASGPVVLVEVTPWQDTSPAETSPGQDGCNHDRHSIPLR